VVCAATANVATGACMVWGMLECVHTAQDGADREFNHRLEHVAIAMVNCNCMQRPHAVTACVLQGPMRIHWQQTHHSGLPCSGAAEQSH
jgi:hypothetical protein